MSALNPLKNRIDLLKVFNKVEKFFNERWSTLIFGKRSVIILFWFIWTIAFSLVIVFGVVEKNEIERPLRSYYQMYQDLDILEQKLPSGGSTALWTEINIGVDGYDSVFWGDSN